MYNPGTMLRLNTAIKNQANRKFPGSLVFKFSKAELLLLLNNPFTLDDNLCYNNFGFYKI